MGSRERARGRRRPPAAAEVIYLDTGELVLIAFVVVVVFAAGEVRSWARYWRPK